MEVDPVASSAASANVEIDPSDKIETITQLTKFEENLQSEELSKQFVSDRI